MKMKTEQSGSLRESSGGEEAVEVRGIKEMENTIKSGEMMEPLPKGGSYLGFLFAEGKDQKSVIKNLKTAWSKIEIITENI